MHIAISRGLWFSLAVLLLVAAWEVLTFELPREPVSTAWKERLVIHVVLAVALAVGAFVGSSLGFWFFPSGRSITVWRLVILGAVFALTAFFTVAPLANLGGGIATFVGAIILAAIVVQTVGRLLANNGA